MKRLIFFAIILTGFCFSQTIEVVKNEQILPDKKQFMAHPKFSPDGNKILLSSAKYKGLWLYDLKDKRLENLNTKNGAGYKAHFSADGSKVLFRYNSYKNRRKHSTLAIQNIDNNEIQSLVQEKRKLSPPHFTNEASILFNLKGKKQVFDLAENQVREISALSKPVSSEPVAYTENSELFVIKNGEEEVLNPLGEGHYIWGSISPEKERILFTLAGKGTYISDLDGNIIAELGYLNAPRWSPDGKWVVGMQDRDNGERITESDIVVVTANGQKTFKLTDTKDKIEMYPAWSPTENKLAFNTLDGKIEILQIQINN